MLEALEAVVGILDFFAAWRFWLCVLLTFIPAVFLHQAFSKADWPWFVSVPVCIFGLVAGIFWQWGSASKTGDDEPKKDA